MARSATMNLSSRLSMSTTSTSRQSAGAGSGSAPPLGQFGQKAGKVLPRSATVTQRGFTAAPVDEDPAEDDEELSFSEFLDGLVAVAMYKDPNPFVPFKERVELYLLDCLFRPLSKLLPELASRRSSELGEN